MEEKHTGLLKPAPIYYYPFSEYIWECSAPSVKLLHFDLAPQGAAKPQASVGQGAADSCHLLGMASEGPGGDRGGRKGVTGAGRARSGEREWEEWQQEGGGVAGMRRGMAGGRGRSVGR